MDSTSVDCDEPSVDEGAFWHSNMDLYYGYQPGDIVEVEHELSKYWLAKIQYCYKHLILLKWVGNYGEFWVDTSMSNTTASSSSGPAVFKPPRRLFVLGYHAQSQLKSQFALEKPTKILVAPSLYDPACDPYGNIRTVDDLLAHEKQEDINKSVENLDLALVCKKKIQYKQEDVDELEAALQNLDAIDNGEIESPDIHSRSNTARESGDNSNEIKDKESDSNQQASTNKDSGIDSEPSSERPSSSPDRKDSTVEDKSSLPVTSMASPKNVNDNNDPSSDQDDQIERDIIALELCKQLQTSAISSGHYMGLDSDCTKLTDEVFLLKPKQFLDMGGANHEKLFVPGTLVEVCHTIENSDGYLDPYFWFAYVVKNTGGRLTLRWFLCDEPKFKQGRLELKSSKSVMVDDDSDQAPDGDEQSEDDEKNSDGTGADSKPKKLTAKSITFSLHFCHPRIHASTYADRNIKDYQVPTVILDYLTKLGKQDDGELVLDSVLKEHISHALDTRRVNLDKDRPLIDHLLAAVRYKSPGYLDLIYAPLDTVARREVLVSCPKLTKLLKATIVRELDSGVFEVHSEPTQDDEEVVKFIYPYDSSHAVLPLDWAKNHEDCLSVNPSRNPTPDQNEKQIMSDSKQDNGDSNQNQPDLSETTSKRQRLKDSTEDYCLKSARATFPKGPGGPFKKLTNPIVSTDEDDYSFDEYEPSHWSDALRSRELDAKTFHYCIDYSQKEAIESRFKVMDQLEITHPSSDSTICLGRIRKVVFPLIWAQLSADCFTLIPYDSTDIYPAKWSETHGHKLVSMLPPRKRFLEPSQGNSKKRKKTKASDELRSRKANGKNVTDGLNEPSELEQFNLGDIYDRQLDFDFILQEKNNYIKIYFNHKCFTGPSLSKSKICSLPQYVGPGPMHLVLEEVVTKVISVAYVPPRILNDLCSKSFEELLVERQLTNTKNQTFKAKYQKRVHRERVPVCLDPKDIALYCECICEHIKCCYNLFGLNLYDGDDCPSHCRSLTKSNKFMKRATYYREKARQGDYLASDASPSSAKKAGSAPANGDNESKLSRARYAGRGSSDSTNSSIASRSEQVQSRASSSSSVDGDGAPNDLKDSLGPVIEEVDCSSKEPDDNLKQIIRDKANQLDTALRLEPCDADSPSGLENTPESDCQNQPEFKMLDLDNQKVANPEDWTVEDVSQYLDSCQLGMFKSNIESEGIDGQALLLLDYDAIKEHFKDNKKAGFSIEEVAKLCRFIELIRTRVDAYL